jgi:hypothetical protein
MTDQLDLPPDRCRTAGARGDYGALFKPLADYVIVRSGHLSDAGVGPRSGRYIPASASLTVTGAWFVTPMAAQRRTWWYFATIVVLNIAERMSYVPPLERVESPLSCSAVTAARRR